MEVKQRSFIFETEVSSFSLKMDCNYNMFYVSLRITQRALVEESGKMAGKEDRKLTLFHIFKQIALTSK